MSCQYVARFEASFFEAKPPRASFGIPAGRRVGHARLSVCRGVGVNYWFFGRSRRQRALELLRCPVVSDMLADIGNGSSHVQSCVKHCRNMVKAGLAKPGSPASVLAEVGDANFNNVERDLHVLMRAVYPVEPYIVPVTLYNDQGDIPATKPRAVKMRRAPQIWIRSSPDLGRIGPGQFPD